MGLVLAFNLSCLGFGLDLALVGDIDMCQYRWVIALTVCWVGGFDWV
jgi:hypothetical protein